MLKLATHWACANSACIPQGMAVHVSMPEPPSMCRVRVLHILRNPYGWSEDAIRQARIAACEMIDAGCDVWNGRRDVTCMLSDCLQRNSCLHAFDDANPSHRKGSGQ